MTPRRPLVIPDYRDPRRGPMPSIPVKLTPEQLEGLERCSEQLSCSRTALARTLIAQGLERLETAAAAWGEPGPVSDANELQGAEQIGRDVA